MDAQRSSGNWAHFLLVVVFGALMGLGAGLSTLAIMNRYGALQETPETPAPKKQLELRRASVTQAGAKPADPGIRPGLEYADAVQQGNLERVMDRTLWIQDRLQRVRTATGSDEEVVREMEKLEQELSVRNLSENQITPEGVEDRYVFAPGAEFEWQGFDEGRDDLEAYTARRDWIRVRYPMKDRALRDESNIPLRSLIVGVNTTADGHVLKANVIGNLDVDETSFNYDWTEAEE